MVSMDIRICDEINELEIELSNLDEYYKKRKKKLKHEIKLREKKLKSLTEQKE